MNKPLNIYRLSVGNTQVSTDFSIVCFLIFGFLTEFEKN